jgi:hypothetical protein
MAGENVAERRMIWHFIRENCFASSSQGLFLFGWHMIISWHSSTNIFLNDCPIGVTRNLQVKLMSQMATVVAIDTM